MNGTGPEGKGPKSGRGLEKGKAISPEELNEKLGNGMEKRRKSEAVAKARGSG